MPITTVTMKQRAHPAAVQVCAHLSRTSTRRQSKLGAVLAATLLAGAVALADETARAATSASSCRGANLHPSAANVRAVDTATLCLINRLRRARRLRSLRSNRELTRVAASQVTNMVRWNYFADIRPSGQTPLSLVAVTNYLKMASAPHRKIMLDAARSSHATAPAGARPRAAGAPPTRSSSARGLLGVPARAAWYAPTFSAGLRRGPPRRGDPQNPHRLQAEAQLLAAVARARRPARTARARAPGDSRSCGDG